MKQLPWRQCQLVKLDFTADLTGTGNRLEEVIKWYCLLMIVYNDDAELEVSDTCVRNSLLSWVETVDRFQPTWRSRGSITSEKLWDEAQGCVVCDQTVQECTLVASDYFLVQLFAEDSQLLPLVSAYLLIGLFAIAFSYISILVDKYEPSRCQLVCTYATYTVSQKTRHQTLGHNFTNYYPIFKLFY